MGEMQTSESAVVVSGVASKAEEDVVPDVHPQPTK